MRWRVLLFFGACLIFVKAQAQKQQAIDIERISGTVKLLPFAQKVEGNLEVKLYVEKSKDSLFLDGIKMNAQLKNSETDYTLRTGKRKIWFIGDFQAGETYHLNFTYSAQPQEAMYFTGWDNLGSNQIWTQGQGKDNSHWLPSLNDLTDKIEFDLNYNAPADYKVLANGKLIDQSEIGERKIWKFDMNHPMSSYLVAVVLGDFVKRERAANDVPLKFYLEVEDAEYFEPTYRHSAEIFEYLENQIGVAFPWQNYKQVPVRDFLYAGMENTTLTIFSDRFVVDSTAFIDRNYISVNAHELAHQWFGDFVTEASSEHHWLQEGFATFYALLAEREIFGDDYFYFQLLQKAERLKKLSDNGKGEAVLNAKAGSITFYQKGAWALFALREKVGKNNFQKGVKNYLRNNAYRNVTTRDFLSEIEKVSGKDLSKFRKTWLEQSTFPAVKALSYLKDREFIRKYLAVKSLRKIGIDKKRKKFRQLLAFPVNEYIGQEVVYQLSSVEPKEVVELYKKAFATGNTLIRQSIAESLQNIPKSLQFEFETLLEDDSYFTQEKALMALWQNFPERRSKYLSKKQGVQGFSNKNIRLLWLTLSLVTKEFQMEKSQQYFKELASYTQPRYPYELRQNAFSYLYQIDSFTSENYRNLLSGAEHPVWRFRNFCRDLLQKLMTDEAKRKEIMMLKPDLSADDQKKIERALKKTD